MVAVSSAVSNVMVGIRLVIPADVDEQPSGVVPDHVEELAKGKRIL